MIIHEAVTKYEIDDWSIYLDFEPMENVGAWGWTWTLYAPDMSLFTPDEPNSELPNMQPYHDSELSALNAAESWYEIIQDCPEIWGILTTG